MNAPLSGSPSPTPGSSGPASGSSGPASGSALPPAEQRSGPPKPRFTLSVGITGHRADRITPDRVGPVNAKLHDVVKALCHVGEELRTEGAMWFLPQAADLRMVSALAEGADRMCAEAGLSACFSLDVPLPFSREIYCDDFPDPQSRAEFHQFLARASTVLELPGERAQADTAYSMVGGAILAVSDILIAVWNGEASAGRGGTGDVVANALEQGKPVIHVPLDPEAEIRILWPGDGPAAGSWQTALEPPSLPFTPENLHAVLRGSLLPPDVHAEHVALTAFFGETEELLNRRIEYPLLLALTGADKLRRTAWRKPPYLASTREYWAGFDAAIAGRLDIDRFAKLEESYSWSDNLATRFAQSFRSGHVVNFAFSALAVALALFGFLLGGGFKTAFVMAELLLIGVIVANTRVGHSEAWQQRWLDYRHLAERLRPMRSLKLLGVANPPAASAANRTGNLRWIDWYAGAAWRQLALPTGPIGQAELKDLVALLRHEELEPEMRYHRKNAHRMEHVNHRLHQFGSICFIITVVLCIIFLLSAAFLDAPMAKSTALIFTVATAALPAFGSAAYGLRVQGDFAGSAARSAETADALAAIAKELEGCTSLSRVAALGNAAAAVMLVDLAEWRLTYQQRKLEIPG